MPYQKGHRKTGGRQKGTPNKATGQLKTWIADLIDRNRSRFEADLAELDAEERTKLLAGLFAYIVPKQQALTVEEQAAAETAAITELLQTAPEETIDRIAAKVLELQRINTETRRTDNDI